MSLERLEELRSAPCSALCSAAEEVPAGVAGVHAFGDVGAARGLLQSLAARLRAQRDFVAQDTVGFAMLTCEAELAECTRRARACLQPAGFHTDEMPLWPRGAGPPSEAVACALRVRWCATVLEAADAFQEAWHECSSELGRAQFGLLATASNGALSHQQIRAIVARGQSARVIATLRLTGPAVLLADVLASLPEERDVRVVRLGSDAMDVLNYQTMLSDRVAEQEKQWSRDMAGYGIYARADLVPCDCAREHPALLQQLQLRRCPVWVVVAATIVLLLVLLVTVGLT